MGDSAEKLGRDLVASGLFTSEQIKAFWNDLPAGGRPKDAAGLAALLVEHGKLTQFQAEQALAGQAKTLVLGDYALLDRIGAGGMGQVFKAQHRRLERLVALKLLPPKLTSEPNALARFQREVKAAGQLSHPHIVAALDAREERGVHYLVMEYVEGSDLAALVKRHGPLPVDQAISCIVQAAHGLEHAHAKGIVHRDIKPANLLIDQEGVVKILDMGLARFDSPLGEADAGDGLTTTGNIMGTVDYMSPEQAVDTHHADARSDIYSLGCTLHYLLTGQKLYDADTVMKKLLAHRESPIPSLCEVRKETPLALDAVYQRMVAKRPEERYQSMSEVLRALSSVAPAADDSLGETSQFTASDLSDSSGLKAFLAGVQSGTVKTVEAVVTRDETITGTAISPTVDHPMLRTPVRPPARRVSRRRQFISALGLLSLTFVAGLVWSGARRAPEVGGNQQPLIQLEPSSTIPAAIAESTTVDLLRLARVKPNSAWRFENGSLVGTGHANGVSVGVTIEYDAPEEYDLEAVITPVLGRAVVFGLAAESARFYVSLDYGTAARCYLGQVDNKRLATLPGPRMSEGQSHTLRVSVRRSGISVYLDDETLFDNCGPLSVVTRESTGEFTTYEKSAPFFLLAYGTARFEKLTLVPLTDSPSSFMTPDPARDRELVQWVLNNGGTAGVVQGSTLVQLKDVADIPTNSFYLAKVSFNTGAKTGHLRPSDSDVARLEHLPRLATLDLDGSMITDEGIRSLGTLPSLSYLSVYGCPITGDGVKALQQLPNLRELMAGKTRITDVDIPLLRSMPALRRLRLGGSPISDDALAAMRGWEQLRSLELPYTQRISDAGLAHLQYLPNLQSVSLYHNKQITDTGLQYLAKCPQLRSVVVYGTSVTQAGVTALKAAIPDCVVINEKPAEDESDESEEGFFDP